MEQRDHPRHHLDTSGLQPAVKVAANLAKINKLVSLRTFRRGPKAVRSPLDD